MDADNDRVPESLDEWWSGQSSIVVNGHRVAYRIDGLTGPDILLIHGFPTSSYDWAPVVRQLSSETRLVSVDLLGFGASDKPVEHRYSLHEQADIVQAVAAAAGIERAIVVAHDYGATVALELVARHDHGVSDFGIDGLVLLNGGLYPELHRPRPGQLLLLDPDHGAEVAALIDSSVFGTSLADVFGAEHQPSREEREAHWQALRRGGGNLITHKLMHYVADRIEHRERWVGALEHTPIPTTFVWGMDDSVSGAHMVERLRETVPHQQFCELDGVGHYPALESPDSVVGAIRDMLPQSS